ncbi:hypothetical protein [Aliarcobacter butzleri]|jgi:undecaprenyl pyrophosphate synthase|uniref:hypothetical protein n=1 Tax=Aliarcobacter butzleri TaxID=28197 RepID=UPI0002295C1C|nr:hypothetical protein [Aliarcobacter butzleri]MCG3659172.1 hypothetical protein [Aliarcobacter butzleri]MCG3668189.1 hypothetical protein [Aliarcobacter butzleri]MCG3718682.1 hypothetical protein [Aliarcobacter butzleri]MCT7537830.1 hypothetical protein [Aliarcobacter butzleri]MCT7591029.1 hypothetical protein [Aliarcobacter butzleri]
MIEVIIENMNRLINELKDSINLDIEDIKAAKQEELLKRNDKKLSIIENITNLKQDLNQELIKQLQSGIDVNIYRSKVDFLETNLKELNELNKKLASIVLPVQQMYKELIADVAAKQGGQIFDIKA